MTESSVRHKLDNWRFWVGVAYFGLAGVVFGLYVLFTQQSNEAARRVAIQRASAAAQIGSCVDSVRNAPVVEGFMDGQRALIRNSILSTTAALLQAGPDDLLRPIRLASLERLRRARTNLDALNEIVISTRQTEGSCNALASRLKVPAPFPPGKK